MQTSNILWTSIEKVKQNKTDLQDGLDYMYLYEVKLKAVTFSEKIILN